MYVTTSPCVDCANLIINAGILKVIYLEEYRDSAGLKLLREAEVVVIRHNK
jgi:dCMP deaminase